MMKKWWLGLLILTMSVAFASGSIEKGKQLAAACGACHGPQGISNNPQYPNLAGQSAKYIAQQLAAFKKGQADGGRAGPLMNGFAQGLSPQDMQDLGAYYASLKPGHGKADPKLLAQGQLLYRGGDAKRGIPACMACHGPKGLGNDEASYPAVGGQHADYIVAQLKAYQSGKRPAGAANIMRDIALKMTDPEMKAVASYIQGLH